VFRFRNKLIAPLVGCGVILFFVGSAQAGSATWKRNPRSGDWNTKTNWRPATVPNGSSDTAIFALSNTTNVSISANTEVNGITFNSTATNPYTITVNPTFTLTLSGAGITNNSGTTQNFVTAVDASGSSGTIVFSNNASLGTNVEFLNKGSLSFEDTSTSVASISNSGLVQFFDKSTGFATNNDGGTTQFFDRSTGDGFNSLGGTTQFFDRSTATGITNFQGDTEFFNRSTAGSAGIENNSGSTSFFNRSTAGSATIDNQAFGSTFFYDSSTAGSATIFSEDNVTLVEFSDNSSAGRATID
jgi:hypothetical protein